MSAPITFATLLTGLQRRANIDSQAGPITLPEQREYLNSGLSEYWDFLVEGRCQEIISKTTVFNTVNGTDLYALPSDFYELISGDVQIAPLSFVNLTSFMEWERNMFKLFPAWSGWTMTTPVLYRIQGNVALANVAIGSFAERNIKFIPQPNAAYTVTLKYIYRFPTFDTAGSQDSNVIDSINNWTDYAVWSAVADCKNRLKEDPTYAQQKCASLKERIAALAPQTDAGRAEKVRDVEADEDATGWWR